MGVEQFVELGISLVAKLEDLVGDDGHVHLAFGRLFGPLQDTLEDLVFLHGRVPLVLSQSGCEAVFAIVHGLLRLLQTLPATVLFSILQPLGLVYLGVRRSQHLVDFLVRRLAHN